MHCSEIFSKEFANIYEEYDKEQKIKENLKETIKEIEKLYREILLVLQNTYSSEGLKKIPENCAKAKQMFSEVRQHYSVLATQVSKDQYYRYNDLWRNTTQRLVFVASYVVFLESNSLLGREAAAQCLGIHVKADDGFHLDLDDLLAGWMLLAEELPRLSVCCATFSDHKRPYLVWRFVSDLENSIAMVNYKGDALRKRLDGLKYSSKRVADVVYDLSVRGLWKAEDTMDCSKPEA